MAKKLKTKKVEEVVPAPAPPAEPVVYFKTGPRSRQKDLVQLLRYYGYHTEDDKTYSKTFSPIKYSRKITVQDDGNIKMVFTSSTGTETTTIYDISDAFNWIY